MRLVRSVLAVLLAAGTLTACKEQPPPAPPAAPAPPPAAPLNRLSRPEFNRLAAELYLPLFWIADDNKDGTLQPAELAVLWRVSTSPLTDWVAADGFTPRFRDAYESLVKVKASGQPVPADPKEAARRAAIVKELSQGRPTLLLTDFSKASAEDKEFVQHILAAALLVERLHARQLGAFGRDAEIPADDPASRMAFYRNQGPWCEAPATEKDENCNALPSRPKKVSGLYPAALQEDKEFCAKLSRHKDKEKLMDHFSLVSTDKTGKELVAVPYTEAFKEDMQAVSTELVAAASAMKDPKEQPLRDYLAAAAQAFRDNQWEPADEAWAKMSVTNSRWYLRIAPDEVYYEPCNEKAGFQVSFALINQDSLKWQNLLDPVKNDMETSMAAVAGKPYKARKVSFHLPDFINIIVNAGDARSASGATVGESLPNWGPVANEGRGRTVAMTNFYTDPDSKAALQGLTESLLCKESMADYTTDEDPQVMSTVLHEAAHNLGPAHEYEVNKKKDGDIFGGPLASTMEELKAQTAALYFTDWLQERKLIDMTKARQAHVRDITWAFGHISRGMYEDGNKPKTYSQLAAIQVGFLLKDGAVEWKAEELAANGTDKGCFALHLEKFPAAIQKLATTSFGLKARGDKKGAEALKKEFVDDEGTWKSLRDTIAERWLRSPKASFVYSVRL